MSGIGGTLPGSVTGVQTGRPETRAEYKKISLNEVTSRVAEIASAVIEAAKNDPKYIVQTTEVDYYQADPSREDVTAERRPAVTITNAAGSVITYVFDGQGGLLQAYTKIRDINVAMYENVPSVSINGQSFVPHVDMAIIEDGLGVNEQSTTNVIITDTEQVLIRSIPVNNNGTKLKLAYNYRPQKDGDGSFVLGNGVITSTVKNESAEPGAAMYKTITKPLNRPTIEGLGLSQPPGLNTLMRKVINPFDIIVNDVFTANSDVVVPV